MAGGKVTPPSRNPEPDARQRQAIEHISGPMLVVAGAGTGKTAVLTQRVARLIREKHAQPDEILAVTYTDNSAREMAERVRRLLEGVDCTGLQACSFHAYCNNILVRNGKQFGVLNESDLYVYLRQHIRELHLNYFVRAAKVGQFLRDLLDFMRRCQDELVSPEQYAEYVNRLERGELAIPRVTKSTHAETISDEEVLGRCREIASVFQTVERMLQEKNLGTFGHMITRALELLEQDDELFGRERARARFLLVDEFQDANFAQVRLLARLAGEERNVFAVGDPDQAIYRFRGASSGAFDIFLRHFPGARIVRLEKNHRSTTPILQCAHGVISENPPIFSATDVMSGSNRRVPLESAREQEAAKEGRKLDSSPVHVVLGTKDLEAADVVATIRRRKRERGGWWRDFSILYRQHSHREDVVDELVEQQVPFAIEDMDVIDTPEVRDLFACLGAVVALSDSASLFRVAALPEFSIHPEALRAAMKAAPRGTVLATVLPEVPGGAALLEKVRIVRQAVPQGSKALHSLRGIASAFSLDVELPPTRAVFDFVQDWQKKPITASGTVGEFLEYLRYFREVGGAITMSASPQRDAVHLMTAHAAKGLEFKCVFILRANRGSFPFSYKEPLVEFPPALRDPDSVAAGESKQLFEQEERRLFYVAMTRARDSLTIHAKRGSGKKDPTPPGFLRPLLSDRKLRPWLRERNAQPLQVDLFGEEAEVATPPSGVNAWLKLEPLPGLHLGLSATAIQTYETCPLQFKLNREWRIPGEVPAATQYGAAMHVALRHYYDAVRFGQVATAATVLELFRGEFAKALVEDAYQRELYENQGEQQLRDFVAACERNRSPDVLHTEQTFSVKIGPATVNGRMDRVDRLDGDHVAIVDYKTGKPQSQEDADASLQLSIYALAARERWGYHVDRLVFHNLEDNSAIVTKRDDLELQAARRKVEEVAAKIQAGDFQAKAGFHCSWCGYRNLCPKTEKRYYTSPPTKSKTH